MKFYFFIDETGDHGLSYIDKNFPLFVLCGCLINENALKIMEDRINQFKLKYFKTTEVILHSREIRKCEGAFQILFDLQLKESFYKDINMVLSEVDYKVISVGINKAVHIEKYGNQAKDPYTISLYFVIEQMIFCLNSLDKDATVDIKLEMRGRKEDNLLASHFNSILDMGTNHVNRDRLKRKHLNFKFFSKRDNVVGLQIADLIAYPLARHLLNPKEPYIPFDVIKDKIYCDSKGKYDGWGLKLFP